MMIRNIILPAAPPSAMQEQLFFFCGKFLFDIVAQVKFIFYSVKVKLHIYLNLNANICLTKVTSMGNKAPLTLIKININMKQVI